MAIDEIDEAILNKLISMGQVGDFSRMSSSFSVQEQHHYGHIMRLRPEAWHRVAESLSTEEVVALIKCLTVAEQNLEGWKTGSVSPVIWLFRSLSNRDSRLVGPLADWVLAHTENDYLPFGTTNRGAKSLEEYHRLEKLASKRAKARQGAEAYRQELARQRKAQEATRALFGAVRRGDVKAVKALIAKGADTNAKDSDGVSISEHARTKGNQEILELLEATEIGK